MKQHFKPLVLGIFTFVASLFLLASPCLAIDQRTVKIARFLDKYNPDLAYLAPVFVADADKYHLDYRLLVCISGVESTFGQQYIRGSYNMYGWGGGMIYFNSWEDGIDKISSGLKNNYIDKGARDVEQIAFIYNPPNPVHWAYNVRYFMNQVEAVDTTDLAKEIKLPLTI